VSGKASLVPVRRIEQRIYLERKYDAQFKVVFDAIRELMAPPDPPTEPVGFRSFREQTP